MTTEAWIELFVTWLPLVMLLIAWVLVMKYSGRQYKAHVEQVNKTNDEILAANREMLAELRQIKQALQDRKT